MRCFLALDLADSARAALAAAMAELQRVGADVRWGRPEQLHVTLKFLGEVDERQRAAMADAVRGLSVPALPLRLSGFGRFPPRGMPRVIWAGLEGDAAGVAALAAQLEDAAAELGVEPERRPFSPHVTLGRVKSARGTRALETRMVELGADLPREPFAAPSVTLYQSELGPGGSRYTVLERCAAATG